MSKSEYARLAVQVPDVVKVIREQVLDEAIEVASKLDYYCADQHMIIKAIENLKNK